MTIIHETVPCIRLKRIYEKPSPADGVRVLVDRLWPRGVSKATAQIDLWLKDLAPSDCLRRWYGHDRHRWRLFRTKYRAELRQNAAALERVKELGEVVTLVFAAKDETHNNAVVLREILEDD